MSNPIHISNLGKAVNRFFIELPNVSTKESFNFMIQDLPKDIQKLIYLKQLGDNIPKKEKELIINTLTNLEKIPYKQRKRVPLTELYDSLDEQLKKNIKEVEEFLNQQTKKREAEEGYFKQKSKKMKEDWKKGTFFSILMPLSMLGGFFGGMYLVNKRAIDTGINAVRRRYFTQNKNKDNM